MRYFFCCLVALSCFSCQNDDEFFDDPNNSPLAGCCRQEPTVIDLNGSRIFAPTVFTPDGDGINDSFSFLTDAENIRIQSFFITSFETGAPFFNRTDIPLNSTLARWDGIVADTIATGLFLYSASLRDTQGETEVITGFVCSIPCGPGSPILAKFDSLNNCIFATQHDGSGGFNRELPSLEELECLE